MWGETLFNIEEDDYGNYQEEGNAPEEIELVQGSEMKFKRFKDYYDNWVKRIEFSKKKMPEFQVNRVRQVLQVEFARVESNISFYDNLEETGDEKVNEFHKIANTFLTLDTKLSEIETKVSFYQKINFRLVLIPLDEE
jgi:hypothetical protein